LIYASVIESNQLYVYIRGVKMKQQAEVKYIKDQGYRVVTHDDQTVTIYVFDSEGSEYPFHVQSEDQARQAMGY